MNENLALKLFVVLNRATHSVQDVMKNDIAKSGLNVTEFGVLELLYHKGDQPIQQIGKKILLTSGSITYVVDKLEKKGLLKRMACPKDRRVTYAVITEKGRQFIEEIFPKHQAVIEQLFECLDANEQQKMIELCKKIGKHAQTL